MLHLLKQAQKCWNLTAVCLSSRYKALGSVHTHMHTHIQHTLIQRQGQKEHFEAAGIGETHLQRIKNSSTSDFCLKPFSFPSLKPATS